MRLRPRILTFGNLGRLTLVMETTKDIVSRPPMKGIRHEDEFQREPFSHEQLTSVDNLLVQGVKGVVGKDKLHALAESVGLVEVMRWKPRMVRCPGALFGPFFARL